MLFFIPHYWLFVFIVGDNAKNSMSNGYYNDTSTNTLRTQNSVTNVVSKSPTTLSSCPFAAWFIFFMQKQQHKVLSTLKAWSLSIRVMSGLTCVSWPAAQVYKAEGFFCWWGAAAPPSVGDNSSPAPSGTPSGLDQSGFCFYARHLHTFWWERWCINNLYLAESWKRVFWIKKPQTMTVIPLSEIFEAEPELIVVSVQFWVTGDLWQENLSHL